MLIREVQGVREADPSIHSAAEALFAGPGDIRARCRALDWAATTLGPVESWPEAIRSAVRLCLDSGFPMCVYAGLELVLIYNEGFARGLDVLHLQALGRPAREVWPEMWEQIGPAMTQVLAAGAPVHFRDQQFLIRRDDQTEETFWTHALSPVRASDGAIVGIHGVATETTARVRAESVLRESEEEYRTLFTQMEQGFCIIEKVETHAGGPVDFRYLVANPAFERHTGMHDVVGKTIRDLVPDGEEAIFQLYDDVVRTGERVEFESYVAQLDMWMAAEVFPARIPGQISVLFSDVSARKRAEIALRESEERQGFLLQLSDALRSLADPIAIQGTAARLLGERLGASRAFYLEYNDQIGSGTIAQDYVADGVPSLVGHHDYETFRTVYTRIRDGRTWIVADALLAPDIAAGELDLLIARGIAAWVDIPLVKQGTLVAIFCVIQDVARQWTEAETMLVEETAERTWGAVERACAEEALRDSESKAATELADTQVLYRISSSLTKEDDTDALYQQILDGARALMHSEMASIQALVPERNELFLTAYYGFAPESAEFWKWVGSDDSTSCGLAFARGEPIIVPDVERWEFVAGTDSLAHYRRCGIRAMLSVPLVSREGRLVGVISTHWREVHEPSERELRLLAVLGRQAADLIEWRAAENALRQSEARYRVLRDNVLDYAIFLVDPNGIITEWTPGAERVKGYTATEAIGRHIRIFYPERDRDGGVPEHELARAAADGRAENEGWRIRKDGTRFWADEILTAVHDNSHAVVGFTKITRDLTHRRLVESAAERQRHDRERDDFRRQLSAAEEKERSRIARELHDQLGQHLAALSLGLEEIRRIAHSGDGRERIATRLHTLQELATTMTIDARNLALELRPPELDDVGLGSALETYASRWSARTRIDADLEFSGIDGTPVAPDAGTAIYRIVQESLTNVMKHAAAKHVSIILEVTHGGIRLIVEDDGRGFDTETTLQRTRAQSRLGIAGMRERATLVGGTLTIESEPGSGTTIYVTIPIESALDESAHQGASSHNRVSTPETGS